MNIRKIYADDESRFHNIQFHDGLNVVIAEITDLSKSEKDTHNLGKTLLISIIDFMLLKGTGNKKKFFLTKGGFENQLYFAEFRLNNGQHLVIRRGVDQPTKISFKLNDDELDSFETQLNWDEEDVAFKKAKEKLNHYLNFNILPTWDYRKPVNYFLRTQNDFQDVFKLSKFKGKDKYWKPFMFDLLGFDGSIILKKYTLENEKKEVTDTIATLQAEADVNIDERDKIQGLLDIRSDSLQKIENKIDKFNFFEKDKEINKDIVEELDGNIQMLNTQRYSLSVEIKKIKNSLSATQDSIDMDKLKALYEEVEIYFPDNLVNDYNQLLSFNLSLTKERNNLLRKNLKQIEESNQTINEELLSLEAKKQERISFLTEKDSYKKFKEIQKELAQSQADIIRLNDKLKVIDNTIVLAEKVDGFTTDIDAKVKEIKELITEQKHSQIRKIFNSIIEEVLDTNALLSITQNKQGNIEFEANIQNPTSMTITAEDFGMTYRKLLCMAFDISLLIHYSNKSFYRFIYHDGALEALDDRKKIKFLELIRSICSKYELQYILTLIDSDLPKDEKGQVIDFPDPEVCLRLNDRNDDGKLFKMNF